MQISKALGASMVLTTTRTAAKADLLKDVGGNTVIVNAGKIAAIMLAALRCDQRPGYAHDGAGRPGGQPARVRRIKPAQPSPARIRRCR